MAKQEHVWCPWCHGGGYADEAETWPLSLQYKSPMNDESRPHSLDGRFELRTPLCPDCKNALMQCLHKALADFIAVTGVGLGGRWGRGA